jgi:hypothetical protein
MSLSHPRAVHLAALSLSLSLGCGASASPATARVESARATTDPCRGGDLVLFDVLANCHVDARYAGPPDPHALRVDVDPVTARSGETVQATLTFENSTSAPLEVWMDRPTASFETSLWQDDVRVDLRTDVGGLGVASGCSGECRAVRVVIEPGGYVRGAVDVSARLAVLGVVATDGPLQQLDRHDGGPLAPGEYVLVVQLPWSDASEQARGVPREARTTLTVLP